MVKTTVTLEEDLYRKLAKEAVERYGKTRSLSRLINDKLRMAEKGSVRMDQEKKRLIIESSFGSWMTNQTGAQYVRKLRSESEKRSRRLGI